MTQLTVRRVSQQIVDQLNRRAAANGRSSEAEHRSILEQALTPNRQSFAARARAMRARTSSSIDSTETIRADRARDEPRHPAH